jgi:MFS family permease
MLTSVVPLFIGLALLMVGNGLLGTLIGVRSDIEGFSTIVIGAVMSSYYIGFLLGSLAIPRWLVTVGHIRVFAGLAALAAATALAHSLLVTPFVWAGLRFIVGLCLSGLYVTVESWLNDRATNETRGRLLSVYMLVVTLGLGAGQVLLGVADPVDTTLFILVGMLVALAVVPVAMVRIPTPREVIRVKLSLRDLGRTAPLGVVAVAVAGAAGSSVLALGAVYAIRIGIDPSRVGMFVAAAMAGGAAMQYPLGYLSDRVPRRRVILGIALAAVVIAVAGAVSESGSSMQFVVAAAFGGLAFPLYSIAVSHVNDVMPEHQLVAAASGTIFVYGIGSVVGPLVLSVLMEIWGPSGYFWGLAGYFVPLVLYATVRIIVKERPTQRDFVSLPVRSSTAAVLLAKPTDED